MSKWRNWIIVTAAALLCGIILFQQSFSDRGQPERQASGLSGNGSNEGEAAALPEKAEIGYLAPSFSLTGLDGGTYSLDALRGKPVVLNFWASWCGPCRDEAPLFTKLHKQYGERLSILAVNLTATDSVEAAREFAESYGFTFPVPLDSDGTVAAKYEIRPIPTTIFVDSRGVITDGVLGALNWELLHERVLPLLESSATDSEG
ncbi:TlpA family protein disulfide reductase [Cohnella sp.]|uniref:TlpA family protein disulfide reductase n=1 Tax=Cohnella sp. TaxID=1883426 RepID=UPI00356605E5